jgi:hypothetical protein
MGESGRGKDEERMNSRRRIGKEEEGMEKRMRKK